MRTPFNLIQSLGSWFFRKDGDIILQAGRTIVVSDTGVTVTIDNNGIVITGTGDVTIGGTSVSLDGHAHTHASTTGKTVNDHHNESHTVASHSDTSATGSELNTLTDTSNADSLHSHSAVGSHTIASHSDTSGTGAELNTLTDGSDASSLHDHDGRYFQESEFASDTGATSKPLETDSSGVLKTQYFLAWVDIAAVSGIMVGGQGVTPGGGRIMLKESSAPGTPSSGWSVIWCNTSGDLHFKNDAGTDTNLTP